MTTQLTVDHSTDADYCETTPPPVPDAWEPFERLKRLEPILAEMANDPRYQTPPPRPVTREAFLAITACFACPRRRAILRALILDVLAEDLVKLLADDEGADA